MSTECVTGDIQRKFGKRHGDAASRTVDEDAGAEEVVRRKSYGNQCADSRFTPFRQVDPHHVTRHRARLRKQYEQDRQAMASWQVQGLSEKDKNIPTSLSLWHAIQQINVHLACTNEMYRQHGNRSGMGKTKGGEVATGPTLAVVQNAPTIDDCPRHSKNRFFQ